MLGESGRLYVSYEEEGTAHLLNLDSDALRNRPLCKLPPSPYALLFTNKDYLIFPAFSFLT